MRLNHMNDWDAFTESIPWLARDDAAIQLNAGRDTIPISSALQSNFPALAKLISFAAITEVTINGIKHELFAWDSVDSDRIGWLCPTPTFDTTELVCRPHRLLLQHFGGITERFNEPKGTRLLNLNSALTVQEASFDASFIHDYAWAFDDEIPIALSDYYTIAREANGNTTICHRNSCSVILFAPDHCFDDVTPLDGCPEFTLYSILNASTLTEWVELIASQWLRNTRIVA